MFRTSARIRSNATSSCMTVVTVFEETDRTKSKTGTTSFMMESPPVRSVRQPSEGDKKTKHDENDFNINKTTKSSPPDSLRQKIPLEVDSLASNDLLDDADTFLGCAKSRSAICVVCSTLLALFFLLLAVLQRDDLFVVSREFSIKPEKINEEKAELVAPIRGMAYLTPNEFRNIRTARPGESVLVTGGLGFIGSHVVDLLLHRGFDVTILDDESNGHNHNNYATEMVPNDITVVGDLPAFPDGNKKGSDNNGGESSSVKYFSHVVHLAAAISVAESMNDPDKYERINYGGSRKVLEWIKEYNQHVSSSMETFRDETGDPNIPATLIQRVVAASSAAIYGDPDPSLLPLDESAPYGGLSPYADTKHRMETLMRDFVEEQNDLKKKNKDNSANTGNMSMTSAVALRFFNVYGPRQDPKNPYSGVISLFLEAALNERDITILGDGKMTRDFVYVKDVARAIVMALLQDEKEAVDRVGKTRKVERTDETMKDEATSALHSEATFSVYNVCTGKSITINVLASLVKQMMESTSRITHLAPRDGDIRESSCNPRGAQNGMGFAAAVSQDGGLKKTADWFRLEKDSLTLLRKSNREAAKSVR